MEGTNEFFNMKFLTEKFVKNQVHKPGDYIGPDGLLYCGTCGEPRQGRMPYPNPTPDDPGHMTELIVTTACQCEIKKLEQEKKADQAEKDIRATRALREASLIDTKYRDVSFENSVIDEFNEKNMKDARKYAEHFDRMMRENRCLLFWGNTRVGKTHAAACIANYLLNRRVPVVMTSFVKIMELILSNEETESGIIKKLSRADLLILDDLGVENNSDYTLRIVYNIIDSRVLQQKPMILTTNLTIDQMKREKDIRYLRIYERIFEVIHPIQFTGKSRSRQISSSRYYEMEKFFNEG